MESYYNNTNRLLDYNGGELTLRRSQNTRLERFYEKQDENPFARMQVVEAYRKIAVFTKNSRQGQYTTTTSAIMIR